MAIKLFPVTESFACEVGDVDLAQPLSQEDEAAIKAAFWKYAVLVFPQQALTSDQHVAFSERFGPMEPNINTYAEEIKKDRIDSRVSDVSNLGEDNEILPAESRKRRSGLGNRLWHTDSIFRHVPALTSLLALRDASEERAGRSRHQERPPSSTRTSRNMPASMWKSRWQWYAQRPRASAVTR